MGSLLTTGPLGTMANTTGMAHYMAYSEGECGCYTLAKPGFQNSHLGQKREWLICLYSVVWCHSVRKRHKSEINQNLFMPAHIHPVCVKTSYPCINRELRKSVVRQRAVVRVEGKPWDLRGVGPEVTTSQLQAPERCCNCCRFPCENMKGLQGCQPKHA